MSNNDISVPAVNGVNDYCYAESGNNDFPCNATPIMVASFGIAAGGLGLLMVLFLNAQVRKIWLLSLACLLFLEEGLVNCNCICC
jgi:hypothetical protein